MAESLDAQITRLEAEMAAATVIDRAVDEFIEGFEADPFRDPDAQRVMQLAGEFGSYGRAYAEGCLMTYLRIAPAPKYTPAQLAALHERAQRALDRIGGQK